MFFFLFTSILVTGNVKVTVVLFVVSFSLQIIDSIDHLRKSPQMSIISLADTNCGLCSNRSGLKRRTEERI